MKFAQVHSTALARAEVTRDIPQVFLFLFTMKIADPLVYLDDYHVTSRFLLV